MPKLKTRKTLTKRIRISRNGKLTKRKVGLKHLKVGKGTNQKQRARELTTMVSKRIKGRLKKMLGKYGKKL